MWSVAIAACIGDLNGDSGYIYPPATSLNLTSFHCDWERSAQTEVNKTIMFTLINGTITSAEPQYCYHHWNSVWFSTGKLRVLVSNGLLL
jgi:hypothetical protein